MEDLQGNALGEVVSPQETYTDSTQDVGPVDQDYSEQVDSPTQSENGEVAEHQVEDERQVQSAEENSRYAKIRREAEQRAEQRARDMVIKEMDLTWNGKPIETYQEYQRALREQSLAEEAQKQGIDPTFYTDFKMMQEELNGYKQEKTFSTQERELSQDPVRGEFFNQWKDNIYQTATNYGVDLRTAFTLELENRLPDILQSQSKKIQNETINKIHQNSSTSTGSLSGNGGDNTVNVWDMPQQDFNAMVQKALNGELRR